MGQAGITGSLLLTAPAFNQLPLVALYYFREKTFVKLQKLVGCISAGLNYHQSLEFGKKSVVPDRGGTGSVFTEPGRIWIF